VSESVEGVIWVQLEYLGDFRYLTGYVGLDGKSPGAKGQEVLRGFCAVHSLYPLQKGIDPLGVTGCRINDERTVDESVGFFRVSFSIYTRQNS